MAHLDAYKLANGAQAAGSDVDVHAEAAAHVRNGCAAVVLQVVELCWGKDAAEEVPAGEAPFAGKEWVVFGPIGPPP